MTHYDVLEVPPDALLVDIKKAYRRLALKWHPDRNHGTQESIAKFQEIGEAYSVLSDCNKRAAYDYDLRCGSQSPNTSQTQRQPSSSRPFVDPRCQYAHPPRKSRSRSPQSRPFDPFAQFDDLFRNDAFFHEAFKGMDDEFARRFSKQSQRGPTNRKEGWFLWLLRQVCGVELNVTTIVSNGNGVTKSTYSSKQDSYEDKITRTYVDQQGRTVMKRSIQIDGNRMDDTYIGNKLVSRKVNGVSEPVEKVMNHQASRPL